MLKPTRAFGLCVGPLLLVTRELKVTVARVRQLVFATPFILKGVDKVSLRNLLQS